ncbi:MAG: SpoIIE family protein phosphatase [Tepidisphaeraceae bacterium]
MTAPATSNPTAWLVPIAGPTLDPLQLRVKDDGVTIGRHDQCDLCLPADAEKVSRFHARIAWREGKWRLADLNSRWGTFVNGCKVNPGPDVPLSEGDLIRITPWTFTLSPTEKKRGLQAVNDTGQTVVRSVTPERTRPLADDMLALLLEGAAAIHGANDEKQLAEMLMDAAVRGTGLQNAALLRPIDTAGQVEIIAARMPQGAPDSSTGTGVYSRSLLATASAGNVAEISTLASGGNEDVAHSIVQMKINSAICVPLMLGPVVAAYLYLDSRGTSLQTLRPNASAFCVALGRMASLALSNLKRIDMEKRESAIRADLAAAAAAQKWIMPKRTSAYGRFACIGESRPGQYVGGDFFDILDLGADRLAVAVGDVSGKGVSASVLMTATQGFLHASLKEHGSPDRAVSDLNRFVHPRRPENRFVTMWVGVIDLDAGRLKYIDAGHSYAILRRADGTFEQLDKGGGLPIGLETDMAYQLETVSIAPGDRLVVVSDGIIEQYGFVPNPDGGTSREHFEMSGVKDALAKSGDDEVAALFDAVVTHAGTTQLSDDATAVLVRW